MFRVYKKFQQSKQTKENKQPNRNTGGGEWEGIDLTGSVCMANEHRERCSTSFSVIGKREMKITVKNQLPSLRIPSIKNKDGKQEFWNIKQLALWGIAEWEGKM